VYCTNGYSDFHFFSHFWECLPFPAFLEIQEFRKCKKLPSAVLSKKICNFSEIFKSNVPIQLPTDLCQIFREQPFIRSWDGVTKELSYIKTGNEINFQRQIIKKYLDFKNGVFLTTSSIQHVQINVISAKKPRQIQQ
jgi:hypothetical protein